MEGPLVSVIVPVYNTQRYLDKCITSILQQTYPLIEVLLVNDGSTDSSLEICEKYAKQDKRIVVLEQENQGQAVARNLALDHIKGEFILFVDSDDYVAPNAIECAIHAVNESGADLVIFGFQFDTGLRNKRRVVYPEKRMFDNKTLLLEYLATNKITSALWDKFYAADLFSEIRFPPLRKNEDAYILPRVFGKIKKAVYIPESLYTQYVRENSTERKPFSVHSLALLECEKELTRYIAEKHPEFLGLIAYRYINAKAVIMRKILNDFAYISYRGRYRELAMSIREEFEKSSSFAAEDAILLPDADFVIHHPHLFFLREILNGFVIRGKNTIKKVLYLMQAVGLLKKKK